MTDDLDDLIEALDDALDQPMNVVAWEVAPGLALQLLLDGDELVGTRWAHGAWVWYVAVGDA